MQTSLHIKMGIYAGKSIYSFFPTYTLALCASYVNFTDKNTVPAVSNLSTDLDFATDSL